MKSKPALRSFLALSGSALLLASQAYSATIYWDGTSASWNSATNWSTASGATTPNPGSIPGSADDLIFNITGVNANQNITLDANQAANSLTFNSTGSTNIRGNSSGATARTLTIGSGGITINSGAGAVTLGDTPATYGAVNISLNAAQTWTNNSSNTLTATGNISLANAGAQTLTVSGTGNTTLSGGLGNGNGALGITKNGNGALTLSGASTYSGATTLSAGSLNINHTSAIGTGTLTISGGTINNTFGAAITLTTNNAQNWDANFTFTGGSSLNLGAGAVTMNATRTVMVSANTLTVGGVISGATYGLNKAGNGTLLLTGANTYDGGTNITAGILQFGKLLSMPATGAVAVNGGTLAVNIGGTGEWTTGTSGSGTLGGLIAASAVGGQGNTVTWAGNSFVGVDTTYAASTQTYSGVIANRGTSLGLNKLGFGTLALSGVNTYTGNTTISGGTLQISGAGQLNSGSYAGTIADAGTLRYSSSAAQTLSGAISGVGSLVKDTNTSTLTLSGNNSYTGTTMVSAGILSLGHTNALGSSVLDATNSITGDASNGLKTTVTTLAMGGLSGTKNFSSLFTTTSGGYSSVTGLTFNAGSGVNTYTGVIANGAANMTLAKSGAGTQILSGANTFTGAVTVGGGILAVTSVDNVANANPLGQSANTAGNLILNGGTLRIAPVSGGTMTTMTTDRLFSLQATSQINSSGAAAVNFSNTGSMGFNGGTAAKILYLTGDNPGNNTIAAVIGDNTNATSIVVGADSLGNGSPSTWALTGANTFTGPVSIRYSSAGAVSSTLVIDSIANGGVASALGASSSAATNLIIGQNTYPAAGSAGATLKYIGSGHSSNRSFTLENTGQDGGGTIDASGTGALVLTNTATPAYNTTGKTRTLVLSGSSTHNNSLAALLADNGAGKFNLTKAGLGKWILNGSLVNTYTGTTTVNTGTLALDFANLGTPTNLISSTAPITIGGGTLSLIAKNNVNSAQTMPNPTFSANGVGGGIAVAGTGTGTMTLTLGSTWTRNVGSTVNITLGTGGTLTSSPAVDTSTPTALVKGSGNIAFATVGGADWAKVSGGNVVAFVPGDYNSTFPASGATSTANYSLTGNGSVTASQTANTLKIGTSDTNQSLAITSGQTLTLNAGGLLFVGANDYSITGGNLQGSGGAQKELVIHQYGSGNLTIDSTITGSTYNLTKTGTGKLTLSAANTFSGSTNVGGGGSLVLKNQNALQSSALNMNGASLEFDSSVSGNAFTIGGLNSSYAGPGYDIVLQNNAGSPAAVALTVNGGGVYNGVLSGPGSLIKNGSGVLTLSGFNTFTGGITVNGGTLAGSLANNWSFGPQGNVQITINSGGTVSLNRTNLVGSLTLNGGTLTSGNGFGGVWSDGSVILQSTSILDASSNGSVTVNAPISGSGGLTIVGGSASNATIGAANTFTGDTKITGSAPLTLGNALALQNSVLDTANSTAATLKLGAGVTTMTVGGLSGGKNMDTTGTGMFVYSGSNYRNVTALTLNPGTGATASYSGVIANGANGMSLTKTGNGTQILTGGNTYSGLTTINAGTLQIGDGASGGIISNSTSGVVNNGVLAFNRNAGATQSAMMNSQIISGTGSVSLLSSIVSMDLSNTYSGGTTVSAGTLNLNNAGSGGTSSAIGTGTLTLAGGDINNTSGGAITLSTNNAQNWNSNFQFAGSNDLNLGTGTVTINGGTRTVTASASTLTVGGGIGDGGSGYGITKAGAGRLVLGGVNTYTGATTISNGTLEIASTGSTHASSGVTVSNSGSALVVNGTINGTLVANVSTTVSGTGTIAGNATISGTHNPGNSPGIQTFGANLSYVDGGTPDPAVNWELIGNTTTVGANPTANFDQIVVGGTLDFTNLTTINLIFNGSGSGVLWDNSFWDTDQSWLIYDVAGATTNFGNLSLTTSNWQDSGGNFFDTARPGGSFSFALAPNGKDVMLNYAISEPRAALLGGLGVLMMLRRRRND